MKDREFFSNYGYADNSGVWSKENHTCYTSVIFIFSIRFFPKVVALGVGDSGNHAVAGDGNVFADRGDEVFDIFALGVVIGGAGIVHYGQLHVAGERYDVGFVGVHKRTDHGDTASAHVCFGRKGGKPSLVKQREQEGFGKVVGVMPECEFVVSDFLHGGRQSASAHLRAQRAGIFLFANVKNNIADIRFFEMIGNFERVAERLYGGKVRPQSHVDRDGAQFEFFGGKALKSRESGQQHQTVFAARDAHCHAVAVFYERKFRAGLAQSGKYRLHVHALSIQRPSAFWQASEMKNPCANS